MSSVVYNKLLKVRQIKREKAERKVRDAKKVLQTAEERVQEAFEILEAFIEENADLEERLLQAAMRRGNSKFVFDDMRFEIQKAHDEEIRLQKELEMKERERDEAEKKLIDARAALRKTLRDIEKTEKLLKQSTKVEQKEADRLAEVALEDITRSTRPLYF
jgi:hypothetical protein